MSYELQCGPKGLILFPQVLQWGLLVLQSWCGKRVTKYNGLGWFEFDSGMGWGGLGRLGWFGVVLSGLEWFGVYCMTTFGGWKTYLSSEYDLSLFGPGK